DDRRVARFLDALGETVVASGRRVAFVAGADLAHVGPRFGDAEPVSPEEAARLAGADRAMLETVTAGDADAFFADVARDGDARRVCGLSPSGRCCARRVGRRACCGAMRRRRT